MSQGALYHSRHGNASPNFAYFFGIFYVRKDNPCGVCRNSCAEHNSRRKASIHARKGNSRAAGIIHTGRRGRSTPLTLRYISAVVRIIARRRRPLL